MTRNEKGQFVGGSGNPGGRPKGLSITDLIDHAITKEDWLKIIGILKAKALKGDLKSIEMLMDRRFGKAVQTLAGDKENPLTVQIVEVLLPPEDSGDAD